MRQNRDPARSALASATFVTWKIESSSLAIQAQTGVLLRYGFEKPPRYLVNMANSWLQYYDRRHGLTAALLTNILLGFRLKHKIRDLGTALNLCQSMIEKLL